MHSTRVYFNCIGSICADREWKTCEKKLELKLANKIVKSRMKWAGHMVRMKDEKLPKRSETMKHDGCRKRGRPQLRWEDCVKRDLRKAALGGRKVERKGQQQGPMETNDKSSRTSEWRIDQPHPYTRETRGRTSNCVMETVCLRCYF